MVLEIPILSLVKINMDATGIGAPNRTIGCHLEEYGDSALDSMNNFPGT